MPRAAVCTTLGEPLEVLELVLEEPRAHEVKVALRAAGLCASDVSVQKGTLPSPLPIVLGHQGAGVVTAVGEEVQDLGPGDHVVIAAMPQCGQCRRCQRGQHHLCEVGDPVFRSGGLIDGSSRFTTPDGADVRQMVATGTFSEEVVVPEISLVKIPVDVPFAPASLLGCGVITGAGAALNTAAIRSGDTVAVLGCGSVGLSAIQGARLSGAGEIIAVDLVPSKLELAGRLGATTLVHGGEQDAVVVARERTGGRGTDVTIDAIGVQATTNQAIRMTSKGGDVVFVGAASMETRLDTALFAGLVGSAKTFKGCLYGEASVQRDITRLVEHYRAGELELDALISQTFTLDEVNEGFVALGAGDVVSAVVEFEEGGA
ncbi:MAG TPA: alcohol dehydrogenase catalytic domain-containing protein [Solirubrobacteraceae bacterium]|jgi:Zn-dependent alcohol dehydrogenase|nr:alcohol dehydrogenase catalytic domain-containing protein [Solirubrobacteraceae bacterium]